MERIDYMQHKPKGHVWVGCSSSPGVRIHNAHDMEERCWWIKKLGGVFYADPKDCHYLDLP
jgi:hypothetical protein